MLELKDLGQAQVLKDIIQERHYQDKKHGGSAHDDTHSLLDWWSFMGHYHKQALQSSDAEERYKAIVKVASLAYAMCEAQLRHTKKPDYEITEEEAMQALCQLMIRRPEIATVLQQESYRVLSYSEKLLKLSKNGEISPSVFDELLERDARVSEGEKDPRIPHLTPERVKEIMESEFLHSFDTWSIVEDLRAYSRCMALAAKVAFENRDNMIKESEETIEKLRVQLSRYKDEFFKDETHKNQATIIRNQRAELKKLDGDLQRSKSSDQAEINRLSKALLDTQKALGAKDAELKLFRRFLVFFEKFPGLHSDIQSRLKNGHSLSDVISYLNERYPNEIPFD